MAKTLQQILGYVTLTGLIQAVKSGIPNPIPDQFWKSTKNVIGDSGRYTRVVGQRKLARTARYGSPAIRRELLPIAVVDVKLLHTFEEQPIPPLVMQQLRSYDNYEVQQLGIQEVSRQTREFAQLFVNLRTAAILTAFAYGRMAFDAEGNLLPDAQFSSGVEQIDFQIPAANKGNLGGIISASWATATTNIVQQIAALKQRAVRQTGYPIEYVFYGRNIPSYLTRNDYVRDYLARNPTGNQGFVFTGEIPNGLFGLNWVPVYTGFWEDQNSTLQNIFDDDAIVFTPAPSPDWFEILEGSYTVPTTINIIPDAMAAMSGVKMVYGMFGYGLVVHNPPTVMTYYGDTFLPVIKIPEAVYIGDATP